MSSSKALNQIFDFNSGELKTKPIRATKNKKKEERIQLQICKYIRSQYPGVIFICDVSSGMYLPIWIAKLVSMMKSGRGYPDLSIDKKKGNYSGLKLELKKEMSDVYLMDGVTLKANKHVHEQFAILKQLRDEGFYADFAFGFEGTKKIIDWYMTNN